MARPIIFEGITTNDRHTMLAELDESLTKSLAVATRLSKTVGRTSQLYRRAVTINVKIEELIEALKQ